MLLELATFCGKNLNSVYVSFTTTSFNDPSFKSPYTVSENLSVQLIHGVYCNVLLSNIQTFRNVVVTLQLLNLSSSISLFVISVCKSTKPHSPGALGTSSL